MRLLVDEMPIFPDDDCMFSRQEWNYEEEAWVTHCKLMDAECDLEKGECSCLSERSK